MVSLISTDFCRLLLAMHYFHSKNWKKVHELHSDSQQLINYCECVLLLLYCCWHLWLLCQVSQVYVVASTSYRKDTQPLHHSVMYSLVSLLSDSLQYFYNQQHAKKYYITQFGLISFFHKKCWAEMISWKKA